MCQKCFSLLHLHIERIFKKYRIPSDVSKLFRQHYLGSPDEGDGWERCWGTLFLHNVREWQTSWHPIEPEYTHTYSVLMTDGSYQDFQGHDIYSCFGSASEGHYND